MFDSRLSSFKMVYSILKLFSAKRVFVFLLLCLCISGSTGLTAESSTTRTFLNSKQKSDRKHTSVDSEISALGTIERINQRDLVDKPPLRHNRFHKLGYVFKKISEDNRRKDLSYFKTTNDNLKEISPLSAQSQIDEPTTKRVVEGPDVITENPGKFIARSAAAHMATGPRHTDDFGDEEDDDNDDFDEIEEEEYDEMREEHMKMLQREAEPQRLLELYGSQAPDYRWRDEDTEAAFFNDDPSQEDYDQEWEDEPQSDASDGPATERVWRHFGTRDQLLPYSRRRQAHRPKPEDMAAALQHTLLMGREGSCRVPVKRVVSVQSIHPHPSKYYTPQCTFLHRCGDDIGCCAETQTCAPKSTHKVELHFYTSVVGQERNTIEKLSFINHTECECIPKRDDFMIKDETSTHVMRSTTQQSFNDYEFETPQSIKICQCPAVYKVYIMEDGECSCDCQAKQKDCMRIKRGKEFFGLKDRQCIRYGECQTPNCEFGSYMTESGRCPKKQERRD